MGWRLKFFPDEVDSMTVSADGEHVLDWTQAEGEVTKDLPAQHANKKRLHIRADGHPTGRNAHCQIYWNGEMKQNMDFDNGEDQDVERD